MAEILINAEEVSSFVKYKSGKVCIWLDGVKEIREVPTNGRLGDLTQFVEDIINSESLKNEFSSYQLTLLRRMAKTAPTVIEAST